MFTNCVPFTNCISRINNMQVDDAHEVDVLIPMYNLIEYSDNYSKACGILWQYCEDETALADDNTITDFNADSSTTDLFKTKETLTGRTKNDTKMLK